MSRPPVRNRPWKRSGPLFELSPLDLADREVMAEARKAAVEYLRPLLAAQPQRLLRTLTKVELEGMLQCGLTEFIKARAKRLSEMPNDRLDDLPIFN